MEWNEERMEESRGEGVRERRGGAQRGKDGRELKRRREGKGRVGRGGEGKREERLEER